MFAQAGHVGRLGGGIADSDSTGRGFGRKLVADSCGILALGQPIAMQKRRAEYIEANRRLKTVNKLEDGARERHRLERLRAEQSELDELASFRAFREPALT